MLSTSSPESPTLPFSAPPIKLHDEPAPHAPPIPSQNRIEAANAGSRENPDLFESLNLAFELATGWTLGVQPVTNRTSKTPGERGQTGQTQLFIDDLSELSFGARIGRRYADNLLDSINLIWQRQARTADNDKLVSSPVATPRTPTMSNFKLGAASSNPLQVNDYHTRDDGTVAVLHATVDCKPSQLLEVATRLKTGFTCFAEQFDEPNRIQQELEALIWRASSGDLESHINIGWVKDKSFEVEAKLAGGFYACLVDFNLRKLIPLPGSDVHSQWIGCGQALVISELAFASRRNFDQIFKSCSAADLTNLPPEQVSELISPTTCPTVILRK